MERLTKRDKYGHWYTNERIHDRMGSDESYPHAYDGKPIDKLAEYETAEEQGLLVEVIRCKDCKHFCGGGLWDNGHWCGRTARPGECDRVTENDFCSKAESALAEKGGVE